jgi:hypothetical protein
LVAVAAVLATLSCASVTPRPAGREPDLEWVCRQTDVITDFRGRITFEDVQRTLCYLAEWSLPDYRPHLQRLQDAALKEAVRCHPGAVDDGPAPTTLTQLYSTLKAAAHSRDDAATGCVESAMIEGMVATLGENYTFSPAGQELPDDGRTRSPSMSVLNRSVVYARFGKCLEGRKLLYDAIASARAEHTITGLVLDVRGTDGAPVDDLVRFLDMFIDEGIVVEWHGRKPGHRYFESATRIPPAETLPMVVLTDARTGSGAEAFAAGLRAHGRALLVGGRTMGKAPIRSVVDLPSGSRLAYPVGDLVEPGKGFITGRGVEPDVNVRSPTPSDGSVDPDPLVAFVLTVFAQTPAASREAMLDTANRILSASPEAAAPK